MREVNVKINQSIEKGVSILNCFSPSEQYLSVEAICKKIKMPRATAYRILFTLEQTGLIHYNADDATYCLGIKLYEYGGLVLDRFSIRKAASSFLNSLHQEIQTSVLLAALEDHHLIYLDTRVQPSGLYYTTMTGHMRDPHYGALGKCLMAFQSEEMVLKILNRFPLIPYTAQSITSTEQFLKRLENVRKDGYYLDVEEVIPNVIAIAVPIHDKWKNVIAACGIAAPKDFVMQQGTEKAIEMIQRYVTLIEKEFRDHY